MTNSTTAKVYQLKITIDDIEPPVWRRVLVSGETTLAEMHYIIQNIFDWMDEHLHEFVVRKTRYSNPAFSEMGEFEANDEDEVTLHSLNLRKGSHFKYEYDFGDSWEHTLTVEDVRPYDESMTLPQCLDGARSGPPEDSGGPWGYMHMLEALRDPKDKEHDDYLEWIGEDFDPEDFNLEATNEILHNPVEYDSTEVVASEDGDIWPAGDEEEDDFEDDPQADRLAEELVRRIFDPSYLKNLLSLSFAKTADELALRKDTVAFLTYLQENKVKGTQSTGNLTLKAVEGIAARFVDPPELETRIGDTVFKFRSEVEVGPVYFVHILANACGLIEGGLNRRWVVTPQGEAFITLPPIPQVWTLFAVWWYAVDWEAVYPYSILPAEFPEDINKIVGTLLLKLKVGKPSLFDAFARQILQAYDSPILDLFSGTSYPHLFYSIEDIVVYPLEKFGVISAQRETDSQSAIPIHHLKSITLTDFGRAMLETAKAIGYE